MKLVTVAVVFLLIGCNTDEVEVSRDKAFCREDGKAFIGAGGLGGHTNLRPEPHLDFKCQIWSKP